MLSAQKAPPLTSEEEKAELKAVLESKLFARAPSLVQFLSYVCQKYFAGLAGEVKEYSIAVEAFGRSSDFHQKEDPIVRVEANRLRKRLKQYYETEGRNHPIQISVPPGQYVPVFHHFRSIDTGPTQESQSGESDSQHPKLVEEGSPHGQLADASHFNGALMTREQALTKVEGSAALTDTRKGNRLAVAPVGIGLSIGVGLVLFVLAANKIWPPRFPSPPAQIAGASVSEPKGVMPFSDDGAVRILAGSSLQKHLDRSGKLWSGDRYFTGGSSTAPSNIAILRTPDPEIYQGFRHGDFKYDIPLKPGVYELRLHFAETLYGAEEQEGGGETSRLISLEINGRQVFDGLDVVSDAGGSKTADVKVFKDVSPAADGVLHLNFSSQRGEAFLNALEILPGIPGHMRPLRITTRSTPYFSKHQALWIPDSYYRGGRTVLRTKTVTGTDEPELYKSERFGNFTYSIPVAAGSYTVTLRFAETYFGPTNPGTGGAGSRSFDVYCNGEAMLKGLDIFKEAGGENKALEKRFRSLKPNAQGKLFLQFVPYRNYACINAIDVVSDAGPPSSQ